MLEKIETGLGSVKEIREVADDVGAALLFDAAHACGMFAGGVWPNPLDLGADLMTMSTYKSLGGPAGGLLLTSDGIVNRCLVPMKEYGLAMRGKWSIQSGGEQIPGIERGGGSLFAGIRCNINEN